jgi:predicted transcriptional regulator
MLITGWKDSETRKRRDRLHIIAEILEISKNGSLKTQIMYRANLSFAQLNEYLHFLLDCELLQECIENERTVFRVTVKGDKYLQNYYKIKELLEKTSDPNLKKNGTLVYAGKQSYKIL